MANFNLSPNLIKSCAKTTEAVQSTTAFLVPSPSPLLGLNYNSATTSSIENHPHIGTQQKNAPSITHHHMNSSSFTYMEIKREPCQVSEVTTSNNLYLNNTSKSTSSTMTTLVKIESTSPITSDTSKSLSEINPNNSIAVGVAAARKRSQDSTPIQQPSRDINYFGIRIADIGGVTTTGCGNIYFSGTDFMSGASNEDMNSIYSSNRPSTTFWQYPNPFPLESVISMSPIGLQYTRDPSSRQFVLLPTTLPAMESFQQAAFLWPPYMQQNPGALPTNPNFLFSSISPQTNTSTHSYTGPIQLLGPNYLTTTAASPTIRHHSQANGSRVLSISSDTRREEQQEKHNTMKKDDWLQNNYFDKGYSISNFDNISKTDKSKEEAYNCSQSTSYLISPTPLTLNDHSHVLLNNVHPPSELLTMPMFPDNFTSLPNTTPFTQPQIEERNSMRKNAVSRVSGFSKTPEMQDVNIQTDTPFCSDDDNSTTLEASTSELISCNLQSSDKIKYVSTQCHNNLVECKGVLLKESSTDSLDQYTSEHDFSKPNTVFTQSEKCGFENEYESNRTASKSESYKLDRVTICNNTECNNSSSAFTVAGNPPPLQEMSGLELLSNISTGSFVNHDSFTSVCVKQEPSEIFENEQRNDCKPIDNICNNTEIQYVDSKETKLVDDLIESSKPEGEKLLGGLNLLCALAEQRIQEEVESNNFNNNTKEVTFDDKKRKHKHSKSKSTRQSKYYKEIKKKKSTQKKGCGFKSDCDDLHNNLRRKIEKVDKKSTKWPDAKDFLKAMESDMRMRLADITRQYRKKKRKLDEINKIKKRKMTSEYKFANISCKNPNFICLFDKFQSKSSNFPPSTDETEINPLNIQNNNVTDCAIETNEDIEETSTSSMKLKALKQSENAVLSENKLSKNKKYKKRHISTIKVDKISLESSTLTGTIQQKRKVIIKESNKIAKKIDKEIVLSNEHLYREETRVLTDMGGLFYAGILKPLQPPDVYAITLDGERGNKSHIMSREEIFKDTILEVVPKNIKKVPTGTRLCAYWSQQYRCLYPGRAIDSDNTDVSSDFVSVEFDDGDSGRIRLQNIRYLLSNYPTVEYNKHPFNTFGKNKKSSSLKTLSTDTKSNDSNKTVCNLAAEDTDHIFSSRRIDTNENQFDNTESNVTNLTTIFKHTKHSKKKKHKKHHRKSSQKSPTNTITDTKKEPEIILNQNTKLQGFNNNDIVSNAEIYHTIEPEITEYTVVEKPSSKCLIENMKNEMNVLYDEDSTSNVAYEASDEAKHTKIDYNSGKGSKIAAFLPERQLWGWLGQTYRKAGLKGRAKKQFYKSISRGKETITVGECAVFLSTGRPDRPYVGRIEALWETTSSNKIVRVRWFYHPEETIGCPALKYPGALFDSPHEDENDVQTISHRCEVVEFSVYIQNFGSDSYDNNDIYYLSGYYNPRLQVLRMQPEIPTLDKTS